MDISGNSDCVEGMGNDLVGRQFGQRCPRIRSILAAFHSCASPLRHCHHTFLVERAGMSAARKSPFMVGCSSAAISGNNEASEFVTEAFRPVQHGQLDP